LWSNKLTLRLYINALNLLQLERFMAHITREDVLKLARLSKLDLTDEQVERFTHDIAEIVEYVEQLQGVDVSGLEATDQVTGLVNSWREDKPVKYQASPSDLLKNAPELQDKQIKVKRVIE
jgi:aspartyl-tRNA(Asn)/glutamyl-tRNA(Gln) amidotransferase subunit C